MSEYVPEGEGGTAEYEASLAPSEFDAFGHKVPTHRLDAGLRAIREMVPGIGTEQAMTVIGKVADRIERDEPYKAQKEARVVLDETGMYRLLATLMTG